MWCFILFILTSHSAPSAVLGNWLVLGHPLSPSLVILPSFHSSLPCIPLVQQYLSVFLTLSPSSPYIPTDSLTHLLSSGLMLSFFYIPSHFSHSSFHTSFFPFLLSCFIFHYSIFSLPLSFILILALYVLIYLWCLFLLPSRFPEKNMH